MMRIGYGCDTHAFVAGRPCILAGVKIPCDKGLDGHSDADVATHALCDALLGAVALGDIGTHFPPTDDAYKNISSLILLQRVCALLKEKGWRCVNADITILAEKPRIAPYVSAMRTTLSEAMKTDISAISVKATTTEKCGYIGREEGIEARAICLVQGL